MHGQIKKVLLWSSAPSQTPPRNLSLPKELTHKVRKDRCLEINFKDFNMLKIF